MKTEKRVLPELSCREVQILLRAIPIEKSTNFSEEESAAIRHYHNLNPGCESCREIGLSKILSIDISCKEVLETCANHPGPLYLSQNSIKESLVAEHVWGRRIPVRPIPEDTQNIQNIHNAGYDTIIGGCDNLVCRKLRYYWANVPLSCFYDGEKEVAGQIPFLIKAFHEQGWSLDKLLKIQKEQYLQSEVNMFPQN